MTTCDLTVLAHCTVDGC